MDVGPELGPGVGAPGNICDFLSSRPCAQKGWHGHGLPTLLPGGSMWEAAVLSQGYVLTS